MPTSSENWRIASRNGWLSMSPTVPPISVMTTSTSSSASLWMHGLDFVGDVRNDLHGLAQELAPPLLVDDRQIDLAGGVVRVAGQRAVGEALVMAQVEVGFAAVVEHVDFAVLVGAHRARIDVDIRIELLHPHRRPRCSSSMPIEALVSPLPSELTTPPVTKICLVIEVTILVNGAGDAAKGTILECARRRKSRAFRGQDFAFASPQTTRQELQARPFAPEGRCGPAASPTESYPPTEFARRQFRLPFLENGRAPGVG